MTKLLTLSSTIITFIVSLISGYLFIENQITFETLIWIVIGAISIMVIVIYQDIQEELGNQRLEQKRLDEKLKIYKRLAKIEEVLKI